MIVIDGQSVRGCICVDHSKKDVSANGKVRWHKRWEASAGYYGVTFRKRSKYMGQLEDFLLDLHEMNNSGLLKQIAEDCKRSDPHKRSWRLSTLPPSALSSLVIHSEASKKESFHINRE